MKMESGRSASPTGGRGPDPEPGGPDWPGAAPTPADPAPRPGPGPPDPAGLSAGRALGASYLMPSQASCSAAEGIHPSEVNSTGACFAILASHSVKTWVLPLRPSGRPGPSATMNLERVSNEEKLNLCRKYYLGGFAFLPFLWLVNIFWFFREAFLVPAYTEQSQIKGYVWRSAVGFLFWVIILTTWITIFQIYRPRWGALGDYLSFTIPLGTP